LLELATILGPVVHLCVKLTPLSVLLPFALQTLVFGIFPHFTFDIVSKLQIVTRNIVLDYTYASLHEYEKYYLCCTGKAEALLDILNHRLCYDRRRLKTVCKNQCKIQICVIVSGAYDLIVIGIDNQLIAQCCVHLPVIDVYHYGLWNHRIPVFFDTLRFRTNPCGNWPCNDCDCILLWIALNITAVSIFDNVMSRCGTSTFPLLHSSCLIH